MCLTVVLAVLLTEIPAAFQVANARPVGVRDLITMSVPLSVEAVTMKFGREGGYRNDAVYGSFIAYPVYQF
jgi:hypothetical protein